MEDKLKQDISLGSNLKRLRKKVGLTQAQAAAQLEVKGVPINAEILAKMEQGRYSVRISVLVAMLDVYNLNSFNDFFEGLDETPVSSE